MVQSVGYHAATTKSLGNVLKFMVEEDNKEMFSDVDGGRTLDSHRLLTSSLPITVLDIRIRKKILKVFELYPIAQETLCT